MERKWIRIFALLAVWILAVCAILLIGISEIAATLGPSYVNFCILPMSLILVWLLVMTVLASKGSAPAATADRGETIARLKGTAYVVAVVILLSTASPWACGLIVAIKVFWPEKYVADGRFLSGRRFPTRLGYTDQDEV